MRLGARLARLWRRWRGRRSSAREPAPLRLFFAPGAPWPSWHPAKAPDGTPMVQVVVEIEASNRTDRDIEIVAARLRDRPAEEAVFAIGARRGAKCRADFPVPAHGRAHIMVMLFMKGPRNMPGQAFSDVLMLRDLDGREHRMKIGVRGR